MPPGKHLEHMHLSVNSSHFGDMSLAFEPDSTLGDLKSRIKGRLSDTDSFVLYHGKRLMDADNVTLREYGIFAGHQLQMVCFSRSHLIPCLSAETDILICASLAPLSIHWEKLANTRFPQSAPGDVLKEYATCVQDAQKMLLALRVVSCAWKDFIFTHLGCVWSCLVLNPDTIEHSLTPGGAPGSVRQHHQVSCQVPIQGELQDCAVSTTSVTCTGRAVCVESLFDFEKLSKIMKFQATQSGIRSVIMLGGQGQEELLVQIPKLCIVLEHLVVLGAYSVSESGWDELFSAARGSHIQTLILEGALWLQSETLSSFLSHCQMLRTFAFFGLGYHCQRCDEVLTALGACCQHLRILCFEGRAVDPEGLMHFASGLKQGSPLQKLIIESDFATRRDEGDSQQTTCSDSLVVLATKCNSLTTLVLAHVHSFVDDGIAAVCASCQVLCLHLEGLPHLSDHGLQLVADSCSDLQSLTVGSCKQLTGSGLTALMQNTPCLQELKFSRLDSQLDYPLARMTSVNLRALDVSMCDHVSDVAIRHVAQTCPCLERVSLSDCLQISNSSIIALALHASRLSSASISQCPLVTQQAMYALWYRDPNPCQGGCFVGGRSRYRDL